MRSALLLAGMAVLLGGCGWLWPKDSPCNPENSLTHCSTPDQGTADVAGPDTLRPDAPTADTLRPDAPADAAPDARRPKLDAPGSDAHRSDACSGAMCLPTCTRASTACFDHDTCESTHLCVPVGNTFRCSKICAQQPDCSSALTCEPVEYKDSTCSVCM